MKKTVLFLSIMILAGCQTKSKKEPKVELKTESKEIRNKEIKQTLPQFGSVKEMLEDASEYYVENGSLKFISESKSNLHFQVSKSILKNDLENVKREIVKRDIIYIAFQTFAQTNINKLTITSIPNDLENRKKYYKKYKKTVTIDRAKSKAILKKYLNSEDFSILYEKQGNLWLPNKNFSKLKFEKLNEVFAEITK